MFRNNKVFTSFSVNDIQKARGFYSGKLGIEVYEGKMPGVLNLKFGAGNEVMIYSKPNHEPATYTVLNFYVKNLESVVNELNRNDIHCEIYNDEYIKTDSKGIFRDQGLTIAWFKDPAGNILSVIEQK